jgi:hypothetical protein
VTGVQTCALPISYSLCSGAFCLFWTHRWIVLVFTTSLTKIHRKLKKLPTPWDLYLFLKQRARTGTTRFCFVGRDTEASSNIAYLRDFSPPNGRPYLYAVLISTPRITCGTPRHPKFHSIKTVKFHLYLIRTNIKMVCGGRGDVHPLIFYSFTSVKGMVSLASLRFHHLRENPRYPLNMSFDVSHNRSGPFEERRGFSSCRELNKFFWVVLLLA